MREQHVFPHVIAILIAHAIIAVGALLLPINVPLRIVVAASVIALAIISELAHNRRSHKALSDLVANYRAGIALPSLLIAVVVFLALTATREMLPHAAFSSSLAALLGRDQVYVFSLAAMWIAAILLLSATQRRTSTTALAATCIPFIADGQKLKVLLILNTNYPGTAEGTTGLWMFPGGHVNVADGQRPDDVARSEVRTETGYVVDLLQSFVVRDKTEACRPLPASHFFYELTIPQGAKCNRTLGHEIHLDFTYIGFVKPEDQAKGTHDFVSIEIPDERKSRDDMYSLLHTELLNKLEDQHRGRKPVLNMPTDIADRLAAAVQVAREEIRLRQHLEKK